MMTSLKNLILFVSLVMIFTGCSKKAEQPQPPSPSPSKSTLIFPAQDALCTTGTIISATQSSVTFTWNPAANAGSYELDLKNLITGITTVQTASTNTLAITLLRNTAYSWFIVAKSSKTLVTSQSDTWKFFNSGPGALSHPPFPADLVSPAFGVDIPANSGAVNLNWKGSDVDNDIAGYDVYFSNAPAPKLFKVNVKDMFLDSIPVISKTTYYWKIVTKDSLGNTSDSELFQFTVN